MLYAVYIRQKKELKVCLLGLGVGKQTDLSNVYTSFCTLNKLATPCPVHVLLTAAHIGEMPCDFSMYGRVPYYPSKLFMMWCIVLTHDICTNLIMVATKHDHILTTLEQHHGYKGKEYAWGSLKTNEYHHTSYLKTSLQWKINLLSYSCLLEVLVHLLFSSFFVSFPSGGSLVP